MDLGLADKVCVVTGSTAGIGLEVARQLREEGARRRHVGTPRRGDRRPARRRRPRAARRARAAGRGGARALRPRRLPRQQRRRHRDPPLRRAHRRRLGARRWQLNVMSAVRATAGGAAGDARARARRDRERRRRPSAKRPSAGDARLLGDEGRRCSRSRGSSPTSTRRTASAATRSRPGPTATEAWLGEGGLAEQQGDRDAVLAKVGAGRPLGRLAEPEEIAAVIVFLCSDRAPRTSPARPGAPTAAPSRSSSERSAASR